MEEKKFLGVYDYTVILTYLSAAAAFMGIVFSLIGEGNPYLGCCLLVVCGILDAFDGKVARTKKNRSEYDGRFGIEIDSLSDLIAFGLLPACIGISLIRSGSFSLFGWSVKSELVCSILHYVFFAICPVYFICALCRLAHFDIVETERQKTEKENRKYFEGVPVTTSAILLPLVVAIQYITGSSMLFVFVACMALLGYMFVRNRKIKKAKTSAIIIMSLIGLSVIIFFTVRYFLMNR